MMRFAWILCAILTGCGTDDEPKPRIDSELRPVLDKYLSWTPDNGKIDELMVLEFGETSEMRVGSCFKDSDGRRVVVRRTGSEIGPALESIVMHELAHCLHDIPHSSDPYSIMNAFYWGNDEFWSENLEKKVRELFE